MANVKLENISKEYENGKRVVFNINLMIKNKEFVVLVGPSGCGKSTTLRMIAGLESITEGNLYIDDKLVNEVPPKDRDISMVFQNYALYPHMTVFENIAFGLRLRKLPKREINELVFSAAKMLNMEEYLHRKPKELSGGQMQRVAVGRAIVRKPKVFLFDEPLSNLDAKLRVQMRTELSRLHKRLQTTIIYVTHDQTEAMTMGNSIVVMDKGCVQQIDTPMNIYNNPSNKFVAGFIGNPPMNFIDGKIYNNSGLLFKSDDEQIFFKLCNKYDCLHDYGSNKKITLGVRPESIKIGQTDNSFKIKIELIEPLGSEILYYFSINSTQLIMKSVEESHEGSVEDMHISIDHDKIFFFDTDTGARLA